MNLFDKKGNAILEMLMFVPLALLLLFVGLDGAMLMGARGAARSALRDGLSVEQLLTKEAEIVTSTFSDPIIDQERAALLLNEVTSKVHQNLRGLSFVILSADKYKVTGRIYLLEIDEESGELVDATPLQTESILPSGTDFDISTDLPAFEFVSLQQLEEQTLSSGGGLHRLAQPIVRSNSSTQRFYPLSLAIGLEITAVTDGIAPGITRWLLGSYYGVGEATIVPLRMGLS